MNGKPTMNNSQMRSSAVSLIVFYGIKMANVHFISSLPRACSVGVIDLNKISFINQGLWNMKWFSNWINSLKWIRRNQSCVILLKFCRKVTTKIKPL